MIYHLHLHVAPHILYVCYMCMSMNRTMQRHRRRVRNWRHQVLRRLKRKQQRTLVWLLFSEELEENRRVRYTLYYNSYGIDAYKQQSVSTTIPQCTFGQECSVKISLLYYWRSVSANSKIILRGILYNTLQCLNFLILNESANKMLKGTAKVWLYLHLYYMSVSGLCVHIS